MPVTFKTMSALVLVSSISMMACTAGMPISTKSMKSRMAKGRSAQNHCRPPWGPVEFGRLVPGALPVLDHRMIMMARRPRTAP